MLEDHAQADTALGSGAREGVMARRAHCLLVGDSIGVADAALLVADVAASGEEERAAVMTFEISFGGLVGFCYWFFLGGLGGFGVVVG